MMEMLDFGSGWAPLLVATRANEGTGIDDLWGAILEHAAYLRAGEGLAARRRTAFAHRVRSLVMGELGRRVEVRIDALLDSPGGPPKIRTGPRAGSSSPWRAPSGPGPGEDDRLAPVRARVKGL